MKKKDLTKKFSLATPLPGTEFFVWLYGRFGGDTAQEILKSFQKMGLPEPESTYEVLKATEGFLVFLNKYGIVIRIEYKDAKNSPSEEILDRVNNSEWILKPIASIDVGKAIIEICPGCHISKNVEYVHQLKETLAKQRIIFWDAGPRNIGLMPIKTTQFPEGVPVVIDRLAVAKLSNSAGLARKVLDKEIVKMQRKLYGPLQRSFKDTWPDPEKMKQFWSLCEQYVAEEKLIAGWNAAAADDPYSKPTRAYMCAKNYGERLKHPAEKDRLNITPSIEG